MHRIKLVLSIDRTRVLRVRLPNYLPCSPGGTTGFNAIPQHDGITRDRTCVQRNKIKRSNQLHHWGGRKPVMGGNTVSETFMHIFHSQSVCEVSKTGPDQSIWSMMAEYGREWWVEFSSHCAQSLHICPKGNAQTSYG